MASLGPDGTRHQLGPGGVQWQHVYPQGRWDVCFSPAFRVPECAQVAPVVTPWPGSSIVLGPGGVQRVPDATGLLGPGGVQHLLGNPQLAATGVMPVTW